MSNSPQTAGYPMYARGSERPIESLGDLMSKTEGVARSGSWIVGWRGITVVLLLLF